MPDRRRARCRVCGRHRDEVGLLSWSGLCIDDARAILNENVDCLHYKRGEPLRRWRRGVILAAGGVLPPDLDTDLGRT